MNKISFCLQLEEFFFFENRQIFYIFCSILLNLMNNVFFKFKTYTKDHVTLMVGGGEQHWWDVFKRLHFWGREERSKEPGKNLRRNWERKMEGFGHLMTSSP